MIYRAIKAFYTEKGNHRFEKGTYVNVEVRKFREDLDLIYYEVTSISGRARRRIFGNKKDLYDRVEIAEPVPEELRLQQETSILRTMGYRNG